jgi:hypothetical protein
MITATYSTIPISYARDGAKAILGLRETNEHDELIDYHIVQGIKRMKCPSVLLKFNTVIDVCDQRATLPCNFYKMIAMRVLRCDNQDVNQYQWDYGQLFFYNDKPFFEGFGVENPKGLPFSNSIQIQNNEIIFNLKQDITQVEISYIGINTDEDGNRVIYEKYQVAIERYAASQMALSNPQKWTTLQYSQWHGDYLAEKNFNLAEERKLEFDLEKYQIRSIIRDWYYAPNAWL